MGFFFFAVVLTNNNSLLSPKKKTTVKSLITGVWPAIVFLLDSLPTENVVPSTHEVLSRFPLHLEKGTFQIKAQNPQHSLRLFSPKAQVGWHMTYLLRHSQDNDGCPESSSEQLLLRVIRCPLCEAQWDSLAHVQTNNPSLGCT